MMQLDRSGIERDNTLSPLVRLWRQVIVQALDDAQRKLKERQPLNQRLVVQRAREWLLQPNRDFDEVCALADLEAERVRAYARQTLDKVKAMQAQQAKALDPGVVADFVKTAGTGGGWQARDLPKLAFSQPASSEPCP